MEQEMSERVRQQIKDAMHTLYWEEDGDGDALSILSQLVPDYNPSEDQRDEEEE